MSGFYVKLPTQRPPLFPVTERTIADLPLADQQRIMSYKKPFNEKYLATIATQTRQGKKGKRSIQSGGEAR